MKSRNLPASSSSWLGSGQSMWSPFRELMRMQHDMDRLFDQFSIGGEVAPELQSSMQSFSPPMDVEEKGDHFLVSFDLPGVSKDDLSIELRDHQLIVSGERKEEKNEEKKGRRYSERFYGSFSRSFSLPSNLKAEQIEANFQDGVLYIAIPKVEKEGAQKIQLGQSKGGFLGKLLGGKQAEGKKQVA